MVACVTLFATHAQAKCALGTAEITAQAQDSGQKIGACVASIVTQKALAQQHSARDSRSRWTSWTQPANGTGMLPDEL